MYKHLLIFYIKSIKLYIHLSTKVLKIIQLQAKTNVLHPYPEKEIDY